VLYIVKTVFRNHYISAGEKIKGRWGISILSVFDRD